jgi:hypothetical protein
MEVPGVGKPALEAEYSDEVINTETQRHREKESLTKRKREKRKEKREERKEKREKIV